MAGGGAEAKSEAPAKPSIASLDRRLAAMEVTLNELAMKCQSIATIEAMYNSMTEALSFFKDNFDSWKSAVEDLDRVQARVVTVEADNKALRTELRTIKEAVMDEGYDKMSSSLEVTGIPILNGEQIEHIITEMAEAVAVKLDGGDVVRAYRAPTKTPKFAPIVIEFRTVDTRNVFYREVKKKRLRTGKVASLGMTPDKPIFVNDRLIYQTRRLYGKVRQVAKEKKWHAVWTRYGKIFLKMREEDKPIKVITEWDLEVLLR